MKPYHGEFQKYQINVDVPDRGGESPSSEIVRYHRQCPRCFAHQLDGLFGDWNRGTHRGKIFCLECKHTLLWFWLLDIESGYTIAVVIDERVFWTKAVKPDRKDQRMMKSVKEALSKQVGKFKVTLTLEEYENLPWTIESKTVAKDADPKAGTPATTIEIWRCVELNMESPDLKVFDETCRSILYREWSEAPAVGIRPVLPIGMSWSGNGKAM